jgi:predicted GNAT family acetyltransferase
MVNPENLDSLEVIHNQAEDCFEIHVGKERCVLNYRRSPGTIVIYHTEVPQPFEGRGLAARMTRTALEFARAEHLRVEPRCPYTAAYIQKHPQYSDLLALR